MAAVVGCLTYEFQVSLPYMASRGLNVGSTGYGFMTAAMGVGAVAGGLVVATRGKTGARPMVLSAVGYGVAMTLATVAPTLAIELVVLALVGSFSVSFMAMGNATLQLGSVPSMRGRVMALWFVAFQGSTPIGGPAVGAVMSAFGARAGLGLGAATRTNRTPRRPLRLSSRPPAGSSPRGSRPVGRARPAPRPTRRTAESS
jgi:MFS family permease